MKSAKHCHKLSSPNRNHYHADGEELGSSLSDFDTDFDDEYNLTADRFLPVGFRSAPATGECRAPPDEAVNIQVSEPTDDSNIEYRIRGRSMRQKKSVAMYYPAPSHIMMGPRNYPTSRFVKLHGASAVDPMAVTALAPYAMMTKVAKIHGLSDRLSLRSQLQSQASTCDE